MDKEVGMVKEDGEEEAVGQEKGEVDIQAHGLQDWANMESD